MKLDYFDIQYEQDGGRYLAGQTLKGRLIFSLPQPVKVARICVKLEGQAHSGWVNKTSDVIYDSDEQLLSETLDLTHWLAENGDGELVPVGVHSIPFKFRLPSYLPSSIYNEHFGWVRYGCTATVDLSSDSCMRMVMGGSVLSCEKPLHISSVVDLATTQCSQPFCAEDQVEMVGCCRAQGVVSAVVALPQTGFYAGDMLRAQVRLRNGTRRRLKHCPVLALCQQLNFRAQNRYELELYDRKEQIGCLESTAMASAEPGDERNLARDVELPIPDDLPPSSHLNPESLISIGYFLKLDMDSFEIIVPVVIGNQGKMSARTPC